MEGFNIKVESMVGGQVIPLLSVDGSIQGEVKNWSSAVSKSRESFARNVSSDFHCLSSCSNYRVLNSHTHVLLILVVSSRRSWHYWKLL